MIERVGGAVTVTLVAVLTLTFVAPAAAQVGRGRDDEFSLVDEVGKEIARKGRAYKSFETVKNDTDELAVQLPAS